MDGEQPSWLAGDGGASSTPAAEPAPAPTPAPAAAAPSTSAEKAASAPTTDNVAGSILGSMQKDVNTTQANIAANEADEKELPRLILFMRVLNMAAAVLLITASVSTMCNSYIFLYMIIKIRSAPHAAPTNVPYYNLPPSKKNYSLSGYV